MSLDRGPGGRDRTAQTFSVTAGIPAEATLRDRPRLRGCTPTYTCRLQSAAVAAPCPVTRRTYT